MANIKLTSFPTNSTICILPNSIGSNTVTGIDFSSVYAGSVSFIMGTEVKTIYPSCFSQFYNLTAAAFPKCENVMESGFYYKENLSAIYFPVCSSLGSLAFAYCGSMWFADLPLCEYVGSMAFGQCSSLSCINLPKASFIASSAFYCAGNGGKLDLPLCTSAGSYAFSGCKFNEINLPALTSIGESAFISCKAEKINLGMISLIYASMFKSNSNLKTIEASNVSDLSYYAFEDCSSLESVSFPLCTNLPTNCFFGCTKLSSLGMSNLEYINPGALAGIDVSEFSSDLLASTATCFISTDGTIQHEYSIIAFPRNKEVTSFSTSKVICDGAFMGAKHLKTLVANNYIGSSAFSGCENLTSVTLNSSVGSRVFINCKNLETVVINAPISLTGATFMNCSNLKTLVSPSISLITAWDFYGCSKLSSVSLPNCEIIGDNAFGHCVMLKELVLPKCRQFAGFSVFNDCTNLERLVLLNSSMCITYDSEIFERTKITSSTGTIVVPYSLVSTYKANNRWSMYSNIIVGDYTPTTCLSLSITADNCIGNATNTTVHYTATVRGTTYEGVQEDRIITGNGVSSEFPQNTSTTETVQRTISFTYLDRTETTTITQGVWVDKGFTITNSGISDYGFETDITSGLILDQSVYDGPYQSNNYQVDNTNAVSRIDFTGYPKFTVWINSYAESTWDFTIASELNAETYPTVVGSDRNKDTSGFQHDPSGGLNTNNWRKIEYSNDGNAHHIFITFKKDSSGSSTNDRGYFVVER